MITVTSLKGPGEFSVTEFLFPRAGILMQGGLLKFQQGYDADSMMLGILTHRLVHAVCPHTGASPLNGRITSGLGRLVQISRAMYYLFNGDA